MTLLVALGWSGVAGGQVAHAQVEAPEVVEPLHEVSLFNRAEREVQLALLATSSEERNRHLDAAEQVARHLVESDSASADAHYWLAVALGIRTEFGGPFEKLTTGKEVFFTAARVLELDANHAGCHEMMGRLHSAVMRLPWLVRGLALRMGMGDALGEASWAQAEDHFQKACALDQAAIAPRLELAKLYVERERRAEARPILRRVADMNAANEVDRRMVSEGRALLTELDDDAPDGGAAPES